MTDMEKTEERTEPTRERILEILQAYVAADARMSFRALIAEKLKNVMSEEEIQELGFGTYFLHDVRTFRMLAVNQDSLPVYQDVYDSVVHSPHWKTAASYETLTEDNCAAAMQEIIAQAHLVNKVESTEEALTMEVSALDSADPALVDFIDGSLMPVLL